MTTNATRLALASIVALLGVADVASAQRGRGGMVGNRGGGGGGNFARPSMPQNFARPSMPQNFNRPNFNQNFNRPTNNFQNFNRPGLPQNINRPANNYQNNFVNNRRDFVNNNVNLNNVNNTRISNFAPNYANQVGYGGYGLGHGGYGEGNRGWGTGGYGGGYHANSYYGYHSNWVNGAWGGNYYPGWGGYPGGYYGNNFGYNALGIGLGTGIAAWGLGSLVNSWGYSSYSNPYYSSLYAQQPAAFVAQPAVYDYSLPLDLATPPPGEEIVQAAGTSLDSARQAFHAGDYVQALSLADQALVRTPNDPMLHEFRAVCLFAQRRYDEAAVPLYTVLSAGPGWDWTTLIGLYPDVETYTAQLRALEAYCNANTQAASARFVLAALYLTQGSTEAAATRLRQVVAIQPQDKLSAQLLAAITSQAQPAARVATPAQPLQAQAVQDATPLQPPRITEAVPANPTPVQAGTTAPSAPPLPTGPVPANLVGTWTASPSQDLAITLTIGDEKSFNWKVVQKGQAREFKGEASFEKEVLALNPPEMPPMVAKVTWKDASHFNFKAVGTPTDDPGLNFAR